MPKHTLPFILFAISILIAYALSSTFGWRWDLTAEKRYTLAPETKQILHSLNEDVYINVFLEGDMPQGFRRLRNEIEDKLRFMQRETNRIQYRFTEPAADLSDQERENYYSNLEAIGVQRRTVSLKTRDGKLTQQVLFPGAVLTYRDRQYTINFLSNNRIQAAEEVLNNSIAEIEYQTMHAINRLTTDSIATIVFLQGHNETDIRTAGYDFARELANSYNVEMRDIQNDHTVLDNAAAVVIANPQQPIPEKDKFLLDRYLMHGGKLLWLTSGVELNKDSLFTIGTTYALGRSLNLEDMFFTYGFRLNNTLIEDWACHALPIMPADGSGEPALAPWLYYPLIQGNDAHTISKGLNPIWGRYASDLDTVGSNNPDIKKTTLLASSEISRTRAVPCRISLAETDRELDMNAYLGNQPKLIGLLLEGKFPSVFRTRKPDKYFNDLNEEQTKLSLPTRMIVIADGSIAENDTKQTTKGLIPAYPLGYDRYSGQTFGNKDLLINSINYLVDDNNLMQLRNREIKLRLLDRNRIGRESLYWQSLNLLLPIALLSILALAYTIYRRKKYSN